MFIMQRYLYYKEKIYYPIVLILMIPFKNNNNKNKNKFKYDAYNIEERFFAPE